MKKISIIGAGAFGFALAKIIGDKHSDKEIFVFDVQKEYIEHIKKTKKHPVFHGDTKLALHVNATHSLKQAVEGSDLIILAVPSKFMRAALKDLKKNITKDNILLNVAKGLEIESSMTMSQLIEQELKEIKTNYAVCSLSGGMIAREVTLQNPLCAEIACEDEDTAKKIAEMLQNEYLRIETTTDIIGIELAGAFKNVIAIGAGIFDGLGYGESSKSAFVSYAARQMRRLAMAMGAERKTFGPGSQAWFGDLMTTCFGKSRNRELGELIGKGLTAEEAVDKLIKEKKSIEGYTTAKVVYSLINKHNIDAPLIKMIYRVLYEEMPANKFIEEFIKGW